MTASGPAAEQRLVLLSDLWNHVLRLVARDRGHDVSVIKRWIDRAPMQPEQALARGVVDELAYEDELDERVERWLGRKVRIEPPSKQRLHEADFGPQPRIGVLLVEGELIDGESFTIPLLGRKLAGAKTLIDEIKRLREDKTVRAVVVRCNSPGGLVSASSAIARELELVRKEKPVVISMGGLCASGGYDVITAGQYIFADAMTITGSIGIFYPKMDLSGTRAMFGVGLDRLDFGKRAGMRSWWKPYSSDERQAILDDLTADYQRFLAKVGRARNMTIAQVDQVARGRVWSGVRAAEVGLVDRYGGLREAIVRARLMANLRHDEGSVALYPKPPGTLETIRRIFNVKIPWPLGHERHPMTQAIGRGGLGVPIPLLWVLRRLPVSLWLMDGPQPLALAEATIEIGD
jgi:protease-4